MIFIRSPVGLTIATVLVAGWWPAFAEDEIDVGRTTAGQLKVEIAFMQPLELPVSIFPSTTGYATGEVGLHSVIFDDTANDLFQLSTTADFRFVLLAKDAGIEVWNDTGSSYMAVGDNFYIGPSPFDTHPIWNIVNGTPGNTYALTLKIRDLNGVYPDSEPFTVSFTPAQVQQRINLMPADPRHATLSWPTNAIGWELQTSTTITATNWQIVTNMPAVAGTNFYLGITTTSAQQFFRLHQQ